MTVIQTMTMPKLQPSLLDPEFVAPADTYINVSGLQSQPEYLYSTQQYTPQSDTVEIESQMSDDHEKTPPMTWVYEYLPTLAGDHFEGLVWSLGINAIENDSGSKPLHHPISPKPPATVLALNSESPIRTYRLPDLTMGKPRERKSATSRKNQAHAVVERRYREKLNGKLKQLYETLKSTRQDPSMAPAFYWGDFDSSTMQSNPPRTRKPDIIDQAINYIRQAEVTIGQMREEAHMLRLYFHQVQHITAASVIRTST